MEEMNAPMGGTAPEAAGLSEDELRQLLDEVPDLEEVPPQAVRLAQEQGIPLLDGYLRFRQEERRRIREEEDRARRAAFRSAGPLFAPIDQPQPEQEAFARSFRSALG